MTTHLTQMNGNKPLNNTPVHKWLHVCLGNYDIPVREGLACAPEHHSVNTYLSASAYH